MDRATVLRAGGLTTIQDLGRPGFAHLGVPPSGAVDQASLRLANRLVGNPEGAACLETTLFGPELVFSRGAQVALTGARSRPELESRPVDLDTPLSVPPGHRLRVGVAERGVRTYVAVDGGFDVLAVLGSCSTDLLSGLGPAPLRDGDVLGLGGPTRRYPAVEVAPAAPIPDEPVLRVLAGPRSDHFTAEALRLLCGEPYLVSPASNRVGVRLSGAGLERVTDSELPSEGVVTGAVQVPSNGQPVVFLADHPTTGGYPVIAVVVAEDVGLAAQLRPGGRVRFRRAHTPVR